MTDQLRPQFTTAARRLGLVSAVASVATIGVYAIILAVGVISLPSQDVPVGDPWFSALEILIIVLMPAMMALMVAVHAWAPAERKTFSAIAVLFTTMLALLTSANHFVILALARQPAFLELDVAPLLISFSWPSIVYALDILAWDVFFGLAALFAAQAFGGSRLGNWVRGLLILSGGMALVGLSGPIVGDMAWRFIGIVGYVVVFPIAVVLMWVFFYRTAPTT